MPHQSHKEASQEQLSSKRYKAWPELHSRWKVGGLGFDLIWKACGAHNIRLIPAHYIICWVGGDAGRTWWGGSEDEVTCQDGFAVCLLNHWIFTSPLFCVLLRRYHTHFIFLSVWPQILELLSPLHSLPNTTHLSNFLGFYYKVFLAQISIQLSKSTCLERKSPS